MAFLNPSVSASGRYDIEAAVPARKKFVHELFEAVASETPGAVAVKFGSQQLTYGELNFSANRIAHHLINLGVKPNARVGICIERSVGLLTGILAVLKAGGAYVPLDPAYPAERLKYMMGDCSPSAIITRSVHCKVLGQLREGVPLISLDGDASVWETLPASNPDSEAIGLAPDSMIYMIYTSGSTGSPKASCVQHRGFQNLMQWYTGEFGLTKNDNILVVSSHSFDLTQKNLFGPLLVGGCVHLAPEPFDPQAILAVMTRENVTVINLTPSAFRAIIGSGGGRLPRSLRRVFLGGEPIQPEHLEIIPEPRPEFVNSYGPTECSDVVAYYRMSSDLKHYANRSVPIGRAVPNTYLYLLDAQGQPVPQGEIGEIYVGGVQVGSGYFNRPDLTAERFCLDPFADAGAHMYKTGDLGRLLPDGCIEYHGRTDFQVKVRGFRVELEEVEAALAALPDVVNACVGAEGEDDMMSLIGFIAAPAANARKPGDWRELIRQAGRLPDYMIPNRIVCVDSIPLTVNGKKDRKKLLERYGACSPTAQATVDLGADLITGIHQLWAAVLGHETFGNEDNFFDVGGTSLRAAQLFTLLTRNGIADPDRHTLVTLFENATVNKLAARLALEKNGTFSTAKHAIHQQAATLAMTRAEGRVKSSEEFPGFAIVGLSGRFPGAQSVDQFWDNLIAGRASIKRFSNAELEDAFDEATRADPEYVPVRPIIDDVELFDAEYFGMPPREAALTDPQQRLFLEICVEALEDAGYDPQRYEGLIGVFAGSSMNTYFLRHVCPDRAAIESFTSEFQVGSYSELLGTLHDFLTSRVAYKLNLRGPAVSLQGACSTSLLAVAQACQSLATLQCDMALAGGVSITLPQKRGYLSQDGGMASPDGTCRPFDARAAGTVFGSGAGVVLIKRLADAVADRDTIYAVIKGYGVNNDGAGKVSFTAPSVGGQAHCISTALGMADFTAESVGYVECHGTATPLGDPIEIEALTQGFSALASGDLAARPQPCVLGSVKANVGHLDAAAGITGLIKTALILDRGVIPPQINFDEPNPRLDLKRGGFTVSAAGGPWEAGAVPRRAGVSAFGVGGTNVHLSLEEAPPRPAFREDSSQALVIRLSARSKAALEAMPGRLADALETGAAAGTAPSLAAVAHTLRVGRRELEHRATIAATSVDDAIAQLRKLRVNSRPAATAPRAVFMFPGQGAQYPGMGRALYDADPAFRADVDAGAAVIEAHLGQDIRRVLFDDQEVGEDTVHPIRSTTLAQPALFLIEYALAQRLMRFGIEPVAMIGHSLGEFVAAALAGVISYEDALRLVVHRGRIMQAQPAGAMLSVRMPANELRPLLPPGAEIASENAPLLSVASGRFDGISVLEGRLAAADIGHRRLHTSHAFHSAMMEPVVDELKQLAASLSLRAPTRRLISTVTGRWMTDAEAISPSYWAQQCREMVAFRAGLGTLLSEVEGDCVLVEVGPGRTLSTFAEANEARGKVREVVPTAPDFADRADEARTFAEALGTLWCQGFAVNDDGINTALRVPLPTYPFQRARHWIERPAVAPAAEAMPTMNAVIAQPMSDNEQTVAQTDLGEAAMSEAILASLKTVLSEISGRTLTEAEHDTSFLSLGFDSLLLGQVAQRVNKTFGVKVTFRQLMRDLNTLEALTARVKTSAPADKLPAVAAAKATPHPASAAADPADPRQLGLQVAAAAPLGAAAPANVAALQAIVREQLQAMERVFAAQFAAGGGASVAPAAAPGAVATPAGQVSTDEILMPDISAEGPSRFRMYKPGGAGDDTAVEPRHHDYLEDLVRRYNAKTAGSKARAQASRRVLADPRTASGFNGTWKEIVYPLVCTRSKGALIWDVDGNAYIDLVNGYGQTMFGHAPDFVLDALRVQLDQGFAIGPQTPLAGEVAARISAMTGNERVAFCNTGSEAVMAAIRVARAVTGRDKVVMFGGAYHGQFDEVLIKPRRAGMAVGALPIAPGIPGDNVGQMIVLPNGHPQSLDIVRRMADDIAAVVVEPVQSRHPELQPREFLAELRTITAQSGTALVFDEVVTGFRVHPGGMQHVFGIRADLATYGKVLGGGMPIGVVAGCARFMDALDGGFWQYGDDSEPEVAPTFFAGTFVRHPLVLAAARAVLGHIEANHEAIYAPLGTRTGELVARINADLDRRGLPTMAEHFASWFYLDVSHYGPLASLLYAELRLAGIHLQEGFPCFLTTAHSAAQYQAIGDAFQHAFDVMAEADIITAAAAIPASAAGSVTTVPLTEPQMEIFLAAQMGDAASMAFNESLTVRFEGPFDAHAMADAVKAVVQRHDALRSHIGKEGDTLLIPAGLSLDVPLLDFTGPDAEDRLAALKAEEARSPFDLFSGPLVRATIVKLAPGSHALVMTAHHIVCDGWSMNTVLQELAALYNAARTGRDADLASAPSFADYARNQNRQPDASVVAFWKGLYAELPEPTELPLDRPRPAVKTFAGATLRESLGEALCEEVRKLARREGVSLFNVLFAAVQAMFARLSRNHNVVLTVPMGGQALLDSQDLVGHCVNFLPMPVRMSFNTPFADHVKAVEARLNDVLDHQDYTLGSLVRDLAIPRTPDRTPLSDIQFNLERVGSRLVFEDVSSDVRTNGKAFVNYDLFLNMIESESDIAIEIDFATDLFNEATISRWIGHLRQVLVAAAEAPATPIAALPLIDGAVSRQLIEAASGVERRHEGLLPDMFARWCDATPDAIAVEFAGETLTYREAEARSNRLAACLAELVPAPGSRIAVAVQRCIDLPVVLLAVAKAGHAYVPIDPALPAERVRQMVKAAGIAAFVTSGPLMVAAETGLPAIDLSRDASRLAGAPSARFSRVAADTDQTAYVIFTSGSTGVPKGIEVGHTALANFLSSMADCPGFTANDCIVAVTTVSFDIAMLELLLPLCCGGRTVIAGRDILAEPTELVRLIGSCGATVLQATPTLWRVLLEAGFQPAPGLKALCGGEPLPRDLADNLIATGIELWNMYGPTETTIWSACGRVTEADGPITIGAPIANTELYVLDDAGALAPIGVPGELLIGGRGLAKGYIGQPDITKRLFPVMSAGGAAPRRLYRTGDLASRTADGSIQVLGRRDQQIKLRGFRIELEEIEAVLRSVPGIRDAALLVEHGGTPDAGLTAAFIAAGGIDVVPHALQQAVSTRLPAYMVPGRFVAIAELPRTANGKLDRKALPGAIAKPVSPAPAAALSLVAKPSPVSDTNLGKIMAVIEAVLGRQGIQPSDRIFTLGATSLHVFRMAARFSEAGLLLKAQHLMTNPSIEELARRATSLGESQPKFKGPALVDFRRKLSGRNS